MDDYKYEQRKRKRGIQCTLAIHNHITNSWQTGLCGCGWRGEPGKKHKARIVKRALKKQVEKTIQENTSELQPPN